MSTPRDETLARANNLVEFLMDGPASYDEIMEHLGLVNRGTWRKTLKVARDVVGPQHGVAIPRPVSDDGYLYRVTGDWIDPDDPAIADGVAASTRDSRTRVRSIIRDLTVARDNSDGRTVDGRKVRQYLDVMTGTQAHLELIDEQLAPALTNGSN